jgi:hypothetical protein
MEEEGSVTICPQTVLVLGRVPVPRPVRPRNPTVLGLVVS